MFLSVQMKKTSLLAAALVAAATLPVYAAGVSPTTLNSNTPSVALTATLGESLTISSTVNNVSLTLVSGGTSAASSAIPITTNWIMQNGRSSIKLYGYFSSATAALTDQNSDTLPSADVLGAVGAGSYNPFSTVTPFNAAASGLTLYTQAISSTNWVGTRSDSLTLEITTPATQPAGTYTGTLTLEAQAQ